MWIFIVKYVWAWCQEEKYITNYVWKISCNSIIGNVAEEILIGESHGTLLIINNNNQSSISYFWAHCSVTYPDCNREKITKKRYLKFIQNRDRDRQWLLATIARMIRVKNTFYKHIDYWSRKRRTQCRNSHGKSVWQRKHRPLFLANNTINQKNHVTRFTQILSTKLNSHNIHTADKYGLVI